MKNCKYCNVNIETDKNFCPLCFNKIEAIRDKNEEFYSLRKSNDKTLKTTRFLFKLFLFLSICVVAACALANLLTTPRILWSLVVLCGIVYIWVLVGHTILSQQSAFKKILLQIISILLLLFFTDRLSTGDWLVQYVFPSVAIGSVFVLLMLIFISKKRHEYLFGFSFIFLLLFACSILLLVLKIDTFKILNFINSILCVLAISGVWTFGFDEIKAELAKKWHL